MAVAVIGSDIASSEPRLAITVNEYETSLVKPVTIVEPGFADSSTGAVSISC